ncbi:MAG: hypothetical protein GXY07_21190 [Candidatus Hydrogenedentes bacterium]|nr:hypothetical protein [Candidatus Hydrogenedentota bacterium]
MEQTLTDVAQWREMVQHWFPAFSGDLPTPPPRNSQSLWAMWWSKVEGKS